MNAHMLPVAQTERLAGAIGGRQHQEEHIGQTIGSINRGLKIACRSRYL